MAMTMERKKVKRADFEAKLLGTFGKENLSKQSHHENTLKNGNPIAIPVMLYYNKEKHVASWCKGEGWIF